MASRRSPSCAGRQPPTGSVGVTTERSAGAVLMLTRARQKALGQHCVWRPPSALGFCLPWSALS